jgi:hypothetical protein
MNGVLQYLWRAVDQHGVVLDILAQEKRDGAAAKRFFKRLLQGLQYKPKRLITDGLRSYGVARRALPTDVKHRTSPIEPRTHIDRHADRSNRYSPSSLQARRRISSRLMHHLWTFPATECRDDNPPVWRQSLCPALSPCLPPASHQAKIARWSVDGNQKLCRHRGIGAHSRPRHPLRAAARHSPRLHRPPCSLICFNVLPDRFRKAF